MNKGFIRRFLPPLIYDEEDVQVILRAAVSRGKHHKDRKNNKSCDESSEDPDAAASFDEKSNAYFQNY